MARVALVTGGTRGIGRAIVERLTADGIKVAAGYSGNDAAAEALKRETGAMVIKGNVGNFDDCQHAVRGGGRPSSARSTSWSTTPASPATASSTG